MLYLSTSVGRTMICNALGLEGNHGQQRDEPPPQATKNFTAGQSAVGSRGSRARWPDLTQSSQPAGPAVACSVAPAGSLSHESRVNSSPPSIKLPSRTSNSIPQ